MRINLRYEPRGEQFYTTASPPRNEEHIYAEIFISDTV
jgi:hypothetical protein